MKAFLIVVALCCLEAYALPKQINRKQPMRGRISNGEVATNAPHACMLLVHRQSLEGTGTAALAAASIITQQHAVTAAHAIRDGIRYQIGFIVGTSRRLVSSTFALPHQDFNNTSFNYDIAIVFMTGNVFPLANVISITVAEAAPEQGTELLVVAFGFTAPDSNSATLDPKSTVQHVAPCDTADFEVADTHVCAIDEGTDPLSAVCPGDNGGGLYLAGSGEGETATQNELVALASRITAGCTEPAISGYTLILGDIQIWLRTITGLSPASIIQQYQNK